MIFSYDPALLTDHDWVRSLVGDTEATIPLLDDQEIGACLDRYPVETDATDDEIWQRRYAASGLACDLILARLAKYVDTVMPEQRVAISQKFEHYSRQRNYLRAQLRSVSGGGTVGLIRV